MYIQNVDGLIKHFGHTGIRSGGAVLQDKADSLQGGIIHITPQYILHIIQIRNLPVHELTFEQNQLFRIFAQMIGNTIGYLFRKAFKGKQAAFCGIIHEVSNRVENAGRNSRNIKQQK